MARQVPVVAVPFTVLVNETVTQQTPVAASSVLVNETSAAVVVTGTAGPRVSLIV